MDNSAALPTQRKEKNENQAGRIVGKVFLYLILLIGAVIFIFPFFWMISNSLMTLGETITRQLVPKVPQWVNYKEAWDQANFSKYFVNSVLVTLGTLTGLLFTSILAGYAFGRIDFKGKNILFGIFLATMMIPESVTLIPNYLLIRGNIIPLPGGTWINTYWALTIPFMANAFSIFLLRQFFAQIPDELWDAARIDGCDHLRFLVQVVMPISKAPIMTVLLFGFTASWNAFQWPLLVTTRDTWRPLMVGLYGFVQEAGPYTHWLMAGAVITIIPILIVYFLTQKQFTQGIATTGLKG
ncbi:MAG: carbohydrate ABC transporter permease [Chloroflexi bacterium]|jgi:ABC-type glycerol-3-phosphate transport system permease component|nr:carbohydrate ABC transporter permease [Anaerolineaceae bacterium]NLI44180.1 carbohydrate ABC transporter permease [Chloroflexota bacterium]HOT24897.1 carbohydrate ABC transporter permease [Anaerolineaceae bacterium]HQH58398.1 carbohydrate ABC transporter permease [Anaerolineaceae bacterium]HQK04222.1 carbohydrate ABC transporter permease [Anaerolineaceae bacterium]